MARGYEFFEHTADAGAVVRGATLERLLENAARALFDLACDRRTVRPRRRLMLRVQGAGLEDLVVRFLNEILYLAESRRWVFSACVVERVDRARFRARGVLKGEPMEAGRHRLRREVKAVTYHGLSVVRGRSAWRARILFDI